MINTGAITVSALLHARHGAATFDHLLERFGAIAGHSSPSTKPCSPNAAPPPQPRDRTCLNFGVVHEDIEAALDVYFKQCSIW
jgi:glutaminase